MTASGQFLMSLDTRREIRRVLAAGVAAWDLHAALECAVGADRAVAEHGAEQVRFASRHRVTGVWPSQTPITAASVAAGRIRPTCGRCWHGCVIPVSRRRSRSRTLGHGTGRGRGAAAGGNSITSSSSTFSPMISSDSSSSTGHMASESSAHSVPSAPGRVRGTAAAYNASVPILAQPSSPGNSRVGSDGGRLENVGEGGSPMPREAVGGWGVRLAPKGYRRRSEACQADGGGRPGDVLARSPAEPPPLRGRAASSRWPHCVPRHSPTSRSEGNGNPDQVSVWLGHCAPLRVARGRVALQPGAAAEAGDAFHVLA